MNKCIKWGYEVLRREKISDWKIEYSNIGNEGIAIFKTKTIHISFPKNKHDYALLLHEIAHITRGEDEGDQHDSMFAHEYMRLVKKYFYPKELQEDWDE